MKLLWYNGDYWSFILEDGGINEIILCLIINKGFEKRLWEI